VIDPRRFGIDYVSGASEHAADAGEDLSRRRKGAKEDQEDKFQ
jgi:hypothetical protein